MKVAFGDVVDLPVNQYGLYAEQQHWGESRRGLYFAAKVCETAHEMLVLLPVMLGEWIAVAAHEVVFGFGVP